MIVKIVIKNRKRLVGLNKGKYWRIKMSESWLGDTCVVCRTNDTDFLADACEECTAILENKAVVGELMGKIDSYLSCP
jgi:hypothetical protein